MNAARSTMRYRATIERPTTAPDGGGSQTTTWPTIAETVPCMAWLKPTQGATIRAEGAKVVVVDERRVIVPLGTDVQVGDRVTVRNRQQTRIVVDGMLVDDVGTRADHVLLLVRAVA